MVNTGITKTSSSVKQAHCGHRVDVESKKTHTVVGALSIGMGHQNGIPVMA